MSFSQPYKFLIFPFRTNTLVTTLVPSFITGCSYQRKYEYL